LHLDLGRRRLKLDSLWVNILKPGASHSGHIHPHSVLSGTFYVAVPKGASALKLEDPRLPLMMAAPPREADAPEDARSFVYLQPEAGTVLMWESWLRARGAGQRGAQGADLDQLQLRLALARAGAGLMLHLAVVHIGRAVETDDGEAESRAADLDVGPAALALGGQEFRDARRLVEGLPGARLALLHDVEALAGIAVAEGPGFSDDEL
jgi:hypothetical protein